MERSQSADLTFHLSSSTGLMPLSPTFVEMIRPHIWRARETHVKSKEEWYKIESLLVSSGNLPRLKVLTLWRDNQA